MEKISIMRRLRSECGVSLSELERATGISHQYFSEIELFERKKGENAARLAEQAFAAAIAARQGDTRRLEEAFEKNRLRLLDFVPISKEDEHGT